MYCVGIGSVAEMGKPYFSAGAWLWRATEKMFSARWMQPFSPCFGGMYGANLPAKGVVTQIACLLRGECLCSKRLQLCFIQSENGVERLFAGDVAVQAQALMAAVP